MGASSDQYAGYTALVVGGTGAGQEAKILSNTADTLTLSDPLSVAPGTDTVIQITRTIGYKITRNGSVHMDGTIWGGGLAKDVDDGGGESIDGTVSGATAGIPLVAAATFYVDGLVTTSNQYQFYTVEIIAGTGSGQRRLISGSSYNAGTNRTTFTVNNDWSTVPDATSTFQLYEPQAYAYIRNDLKARNGTGDPDFKFRQGVLRSSSNPNGDTVSFDWWLESSLGTENVEIRFGRFTKTEGTARVLFFYDEQETLIIDLKNGYVINNSNFGGFQVGLNCRFNNNGLGQGGVQIYNGSTWVNAVMGDASTTANDTRLLVYDVTAGALRRVTIGAADSGGAGYRALRIPN
jgi:hypothetical protein